MRVRAVVAGENQMSSAVGRLGLPPGLKHKNRPHQFGVISPAVQVLMPRIADTFGIKNALLFKRLLGDEVFDPISQRTYQPLFHRNVKPTLGPVNQ